MWEAVYLYVKEKVEFSIGWHGHLFSLNEAIKGE